jgi:MFS family permease
LIQTESHGWLVDGALPFLLAAAILLVAFVRREATAGAPLIPLDIFRSHELSAGVVLALMASLCQFTVVFFITLFLQRVQGLSPAEAGARMLALTGTEIVAGPLGGRLADRIGPRLPLTVAFVGMAISLAALSQLGPGSSYLLIGPALAAVGLGIGIMGSAASACVVGNAPRDRAGVASGIQVTAFQIGAVLGTSALGSVIAARVSAVFPADLVAAGLPARLFHPQGPASRAVSEALVPIAPGHPGLLPQIRQASFAAFTDGLDVAFAVAAVIAVFCAVLSYVATSRGARANDVEEADHFSPDLVPASSVIPIAVPEPD